VRSGSEGGSSSRMRSVSTIGRLTFLRFGIGTHKLLDQQPTVYPCCGPSFRRPCVESAEPGAGWRGQALRARQPDGMY
jgi:hypothetical protein